MKALSAFEQAALQMEVAELRKQVTRWRKQAAELQEKLEAKEQSLSRQKIEEVFRQESERTVLIMVLISVLYVVVGSIAFYIFS